MPDKEDEDKDKYNRGGFAQGSDGGVYAVPGGVGSSSDYATWDWKQIKAAITGGAAFSDEGGGAERAGQVSDPASLWRAGSTLLHVQQVLEMVGRQLEDQATAVAGGEGAPWRGEAAQQFLLMTRGFAQKVRAAAAVLSGGDTGTNSVPNQLVANGNSLSHAITLVEAIDSHYARQARLMGVQPMDNGLIPVSQKPEVVELLNRDMRRVLMDLADHYSVTIDAVRQPAPVVNPVTGSTSGNPLSGLGLPGLPSGPGVPGGPDLSAVPGAGEPGSPDATVGAPDGFNVPDLASGPGAADLGGAPDLAATEFGGQLPESALGAAAGGGEGFSPQEFPGFDASSAPGLTGADLGTEGQFVPPVLTPFAPSAFAPSSRGSNADTQVPNLRGVEEFPGQTTTVPPTFSPGAGGPTSTERTAAPTGLSLPEYTPAEFPGLAGLEGGGDSSAAFSSGGSDLGSSPGAVAPSEFPTHAGLPDASTPGVSPSGQDTAGAGPTLSNPGVLSPGAGAQAPGSHMGGGMPMMPMMPGMGGGAGGQGAGEGSDASGLIIPGSEPWQDNRGLDDAEALAEGDIAGAEAGSGELVDAGGEPVSESAWPVAEGDEGDEGNADETTVAAGAPGDVTGQGAPPPAQVTFAVGDPQAGAASSGTPSGDDGHSAAMAAGTVAAATAGAVLVAGAAVGAASARTGSTVPAGEGPSASAGDQSWDDGDDDDAATSPGVPSTPSGTDGDEPPSVGRTPDTAPGRTAVDDWDADGSPFALGRQSLAAGADNGRTGGGHGDGHGDGDGDGPRGESTGPASRASAASGPSGVPGDDESPLTVWRPARSAVTPPVDPLLGGMPLRSGSDDGTGNEEPPGEDESDEDAESRAASRFANLLSQQGGSWDGDADRRAAPGVLE